MEPRTLTCRESFVSFVTLASGTHVIAPFDPRLLTSQGNAPAAFHVSFLNHRPFAIQVDIRIHSDS